MNAWTDYAYADLFTNYSDGNPHTLIIVAYIPTAGVTWWLDNLRIDMASCTNVDCSDLDVPAERGCYASFPNIVTSCLDTTLSPAAGTQYAIGVHTLNVTVTNDYGDVFQCNETFTVLNRTLPVTCPNAVSLTLPVCAITAYFH